MPTKQPKITEDPIYTLKIKSIIMAQEYKQNQKLSNIRKFTENKYHNYLQIINNQTQKIINIMILIHNFFLLHEECFHDDHNMDFITSQYLSLVVEISTYSATIKKLLHIKKYIENKKQDNIIYVYNVYKKMYANYIEQKIKIENCNGTFIDKWNSAMCAARVYKIMSPWDLQNAHKAGITVVSRYANKLLA